MMRESPRRLWGFADPAARTRGSWNSLRCLKTPIKALIPCYATQEGNYNGTEGISALPFNGINLAHSNESESVTFLITKTTKPSSIVFTS
ncbi:hypothetical protein ACLB1E_20340 [Escherichia coli]